jgi:CHAT domain-containing protein/tetratricopeptide (TPR) repeat protein
VKQLRAWLAVLSWAAVDLEALRAEDATPLEPGKSLDRQIAGGQSHRYRFAIDVGQYAMVSVDQRSVNVVISVEGPDGRKLANVHRLGGRTSAELIAEVTGTHVVTLTPAATTAPLGAYEITLANLEAATDRHKSQVAAARAFDEATALWLRRTRDAVLTATERFEVALRHSRAAGDVAAEATILYSIALAYAEIGEREKALAYATQSLPIARKSQNRAIEAWALNIVGTMENTFGDRRKAVEHFEEALPLMRAAGDRPGMGDILNNLGMAHARMGEKRKALAYFDEAVEVYTAMQDRRRLGTLASNVGMTHGDLGDYHRALAEYDRALAIHRELSNRVSEAISLNNIGAAYSSLADYQKALDAYTASLAINRELGRSWDVAVNLHNLAWVYANLGNRARALELYQDALGILRTVKDPSSLANTLSNLGATYADAGDHRKALELHNEALALRRGTRDRDGEAISLNNMGRTYAMLGDAAKAREHVEQAIGILRGTGARRTLAGALRSLGSLDREGGDPQKASERLMEALEIHRSIHDRRGEADTLADLAKAARDRGDFAAAHRWADEALARMESLRLTVASPTLRASFFAAAREAQEVDIDALMRLDVQFPGQGFSAKALLASERGRARTLLETLGESGAEIRRGVDAALIERERELERLIAAKAERRTRLLSGKHNEADAAAMTRDLDALAGDLDGVQSKIRESSPQYAALTRPAPLDVREIQSKVLDEDTVLLEYTLGKDRSFLWVVTPSSFEAFELPARGRIEAAVQRVYELLTARNRRPSTETPPARAARVGQADQAYAAASTEASRILLTPAAARIEGKRLLIVGDGVLHYLPFAALPDPGSSIGTPLVIGHEIVAAPSASVLAVLRQETAHRERAPKSVAVLADPVFTADDPRMAKRRVAPASLTASAARSDADLRGREFVRLRFSRSEADAIARLAPAGSTLRALDFDASRATVLGPELGQYRVVHFATHGLLDTERPELSGVVLSLVDREGRPQNGFLRLYDIYNLRLNSELVVLSACQTALGAEIKGEGLIGLTRGFLYAGAARVMASVWEVDDRATAELMKRFYEAMLSRHEPPAAALRAAQIQMWTKGWDAPYYWAAFTLQGEWR